MKNFIYFLLLSLYCSIGTSHAQSAQNALKKGNKNYEDKKYIQAETSYRLAQSKNKENNVAEYNMGNSLYRQKLSNEAIATYLRAIKNAKTKEDKHRAFHNLGNAYLKEKKYKEAEDAYKNALRNNPKDDETRYNFALAKKLNQEHPDQNQDNKDNKDQNKDNKDQNKDNQDKQDNQDQNKNDQQNKQDQDKDDKSNDDKNSDNKNDKDNQQNKDQSDQDKNDNQDQNDSDSEPKPTPQQQASKDQMERLLEAINQEERKVQQRLINKDKKGEGKETTGQGTNKKDW